MPRPNFKFDPANGRRILSDVVVSPKKEISSQFFKEPDRKIGPRPYSGGGKQRWSLPKKTAAVLAVALLGWVAWGLFNSRMEITVVSKAGIFPVDMVASLSEINAVSVPVNKEAVFPSGEEKTVEERARGNIVVFNKDSIEPQTLIATTRFETPDGKIYRIPKRITVPGYTVKNGNIVAGSLEVEVVADKPGEEHNIGLTDFTLPGLKGSAKYDGIFARSKTPMTGGFTGKNKIISEADVKRAVDGLIAKGKEESAFLLKEKLLPGVFLLVSSVSYNVKDITVAPEAGSVGEEFKAVVSGEASGIFADRRLLERMLTDTSDIKNHFGELPVRVDNLEHLEAELLGFSEEKKEARVRFRGRMEVSAYLDDTEFKKRLIERNLKTASAIVDSFPEIVGAEVSFSPFWLRRVPSSPARILVNF